MKKFEIISYNYDEQKISLRLNHLVNNGLIIIKDIDLDATLYKMEIGNVGPGWNCFIIPTPKHGMDFNSNDFGGFIVELLDDDVILERDMLRLRYTDMYKYKQNINDHYHPSFRNYREFFVRDIYKDFNLDNCSNVIDAGASIGLFTRYMLNKGTQNIASVECDDRSITALVSNFIHNPKVKIISKALSDNNGEKTLYWDDANPLVNSLSMEDSDFQYYDSPNTKIVPTITLETLIHNLGWETIDLLKIDIEGSEWDVIPNTPDYIFNNVHKILLEYHLPKGRLQPIIDRFSTLGFNHKFEPGLDGLERNGVIFFFK